MSTVPQVQGYHNELPDGALSTAVPGMPQEKPQKTTPLAAQALQVPSTPQFPGTASTAEPDEDEGALPDIDNAEEVQEEGQFDTQEILEQGASGDGLSAEQQKQAKTVIKDFVKEMVRGRKMSVVSKAGAVRVCTVFLSRKLDSFKIQAGNNTKKISLTDIADIHIGQDGPSIDTPLDDMCCTMALAAGECLTFRFPDVIARDTFAMCMLMFVNGARGN